MTFFKKTMVICRLSSARRPCQPALGGVHVQACSMGHRAANRGGGRLLRNVPRTFPVPLQVQGRGAGTPGARDPRFRVLNRGEL